MVTIKINPWDPQQGEFVVIDAADFDPSKHERFPGDDTPIPGKYDFMPRAQLIELALVGVKEELSKLTDDEIRAGLEGRDRREARHADDDAQGHLDLGDESLQASDLGNDVISGSAGDDAAPAAASRRRGKPAQDAEPAPQPVLEPAPGDAAPEAVGDASPPAGDQPQEPPVGA